MNEDASQLLQRLDWCERTLADFERRLMVLEQQIRQREQELRAKGRN